MKLDYKRVINKIFKMIDKLSIFLLVFVIGITNCFAYSYNDFNYDEFVKKNKNYWAYYCDSKDEKCVDQVIKDQKKFYTKLYKLLAKYENAGYIIDDVVIIATVFFEYGPSSFNDTSGSYNLDDDDGSNFDVDADLSKEFFERETDTLKLLLSAMVGYDRVCYGVTPASIDNSSGEVELPREDENEETEKTEEETNSEEENTALDDKDNKKKNTNYACDEGKLYEVEEDKFICLTSLQIEAVKFWEKFADSASSFFGLKTKSSLDCDALAKEKGYNSGKVITGETKRVIEDAYWEFLTNGRYFDNKPNLYHRYKALLEKAGVTEIKDLYGNDEYEKELIEVREGIVRDIKSIIDTFRESRPTAEFTTPSSISTWWWPIGSSTTTEKDGVLFASDDPVSVAITSHFGTRLDPVSKEVVKTHRGIDIGNLNGNGSSYVIASKAGKVVAVNNTCRSNGQIKCGGGYGNYVQIEHSNGINTMYAHLHEGTITVKKGDAVSQGQVIGKAGSSGNSTGTHLHFEIRMGSSNTTAVDPLTYVDPNNPRPTTASINMVDGADNKQQVCLSLKASGFSDTGVAAIMVNMEKESNFNNHASGDDGDSYGLCQWNKSRYQKLKDYTSKWQTVEGQLDYLMYELQSGYMSLYNDLQSGQGAYSLSEKFCKVFEKPYSLETVCPERAESSSLSMFQYVSNGCS